VWTLDTSPTGDGPSDVVRIDAGDDYVSFVDTDARAGALAADGRSVWLSGGTEAIEIDAASGEIAQRIELPGGFSPFAVASGRVWSVSQMTGSQYDVVGLNPETGEIDSSVTIESSSPATLHPVSGEPSPNSDALWIAEYRRDVTHVSLS
jgi:streptogramin lyase